MATLVVSPRNSLRQVRSSSSTRTLDDSRAKKLSNRHLPYCPPGAPRSRSRTPVTPPASPPDVKIPDESVLSLLHPADMYTKIHEDHNIYALDAATLHRAITHQASSALPDPKNVFPWLHGLHPDNEMQLAFFLARRKATRNAPQCMRGMTILKVGGDLTKSRLKGAVAPDEVLAAPGAEHQTFYDMDPREGFSVRSFHIQVSKMALVSDIVVYKDEQTPTKDLQELALRCAAAQHWYREKCKKDGYELPEFNTFVVMSPFNHFEKQFPDIVAVDSKGENTGNVMDFFVREKYEMCTMSKASEIARNVWLGPSPDSTCGRTANFIDGKLDFDILIETNDSAALPTHEKLRDVARRSALEAQKMDFPSSGSIMPPSWNHAEIDALLATVQWIYKGANANVVRDHVSDTEDDSDGDVDQNIDGDGDIPMESLGRRKPGCRFLVHCADGYTESSLLGLAYIMYADCLTAHEAWLKMHTQLRRNFFAYHSDVNLLSAIEPRIMQASPKRQGAGIPASPPAPPQWFKRIDGSLPSRVTPYMYLGNLNHANNPELLELLGIHRVLSVGEPIAWPAKRKEQWGRDNLLYVDNIQDNGVDPLTADLDRCLEFIAQGRAQGIATLVHCRVGVSRSATICIAECMKEMKLSLPRAYCFVRARRLNVIIQPHLRFTYELLKWEEEVQIRSGKPVRRELEWQDIAREIAAMNKPYTKGGQ